MRAYYRTLNLWRVRVLYVTSKNVAVYSIKREEEWVGREPRKLDLATIPDERRILLLRAGNLCAFLLSLDPICTTHPPTGNWKCVCSREKRGGVFLKSIRGVLPRSLRVKQGRMASRGFFDTWFSIAFRNTLVAILWLQKVRLIFLGNLSFPHSHMFWYYIITGLFLTNLHNKRVLTVLAVQCTIVCWK